MPKGSRNSGAARGYFLGQLPGDQFDEARTYEEEAGVDRFEPPGSGRGEPVPALEAEAHLDRIAWRLDGQLQEEPETIPFAEPVPAPQSGDDTDVSAGTVPPSGTPRTDSAARKPRARRRRLRVALLMAVAAALVTGTGVYVATSAQGGHEPPSTRSFGRQSPSTTVVVGPTSTLGAVHTELAPESPTMSTSLPTAPQGTSSTRSSTSGTGGPAEAPSSPATSSPGAPPTTAPPPSAAGEAKCAKCCKSSAPSVPPGNSNRCRLGETGGGR
jgi:hypothetical protein